jgi:hypothetical protein
VAEVNVGCIWENWLKIGVRYPLFFLKSETIYLDTFIGAMLFSKKY